MVGDAEAENAGMRGLQAPTGTQTYHLPWTTRPMKYLENHPAHSSLLVSTPPPTPAARRADMLLTHGGPGFLPLPPLPWSTGKVTRQRQKGPRPAVGTEASAQALCP